MQLNPSLTAFVGLLVFLLGLAIKHFGWSPEGRPMFWTIVGISLVGGVVQAIVSAQVAPFPPAPADALQLIFVWVPTVLGWIAASGTAVLAASQVIYGIIIKGLRAPQTPPPEAPATG